MFDLPFLRNNPSAVQYIIVDYNYTTYPTYLKHHPPYLKYHRKPHHYIPSAKVINSASGTGMQELARRLETLNYNLVQYLYLGV